MITLAETEPTEVITGYGIWKTTEDKVPMVVQRRHAQRTAYVWGVSLDGSSLSLQVSDVGSENKSLDRSQAVKVRVTSGNKTWYLVANPHRKKVTFGLPIDSHIESDAVFSVH